MDRLKSIEAFVTAVDLGSFAKAAQRLGISPPMVAKHVQSLEAQLGLRLLNRTTRRQSLTDAGRRYHERCQRVLAELAAADALASGEHAEPQGRVAVSAPHVFGWGSLCRFITQFLQRYPQASVDLTLTDRLADLRKDPIDVAFDLGDVQVDPDPQVRSVALRPYRLVVAASPAYLARHGMPTQPDDLAAHECIHDLGRNVQQWRFVRDGRLHQARITGRLRVDDCLSKMQAAIGGHGIMIGPDDLLADALRAGNLVQLLRDYELGQNDMALRHPVAGEARSVVNLFVQEAVKAFGPPPRERGGRGHPPHEPARPQGQDEAA